MAVGTQSDAGQTGDNIVVGGATYTIATDWQTYGGTGFSAAHVQIVKPGWGDTDTTYRVSKEHPLPVQLYDNSAGYTAALINAGGALNITGGVQLANNYVNVGVVGTDLSAEGTQAIKSIIQIVGPTFGASGPTGYRPHTWTEDSFMPIKVTGSVKGQHPDGRFGVTFTRAEVRQLYAGPIGWPGYGGTWIGYTAALNLGADARVAKGLPEFDIDQIMVQGISGGTPVGITAQSETGLLTRRMESRYTRLTGATWADVKDSIAVEGFAGMTAIAITGGVVIHKQPHGGSFEVRDLEASRDSVSMYSADGSTAAQVKLLSGNGTPIGVSAGALKVAIDNGSFTANVTIGAITGVTNSDEPPLRVMGATSSTHAGLAIDPIIVKGNQSDGSLAVSSTSGLNIRSLVDTDVVSLGGQAGTNLGGIRSTTDNIASKTSSIQGDMSQTRISSGIIKDVVSGATAIRAEIVRINQPTSLLAESISCGTSARALSGISTPIHSGVYVCSDPANTSNVRVGNSSLVSNGNRGKILEPGESVFLQVDNLTKIYARSISGNSMVNVIGS